VYDRVAALLPISKATNKLPISALCQETHLRSQLERLMRRPKKARMQGVFCFQHLVRAETVLAGTCWASEEF
jgi:hypothetical protein